MEESTLNQPWFTPTPFQQTIELADGTVVNGSAGLNSENDDLWVWLEKDTTDMATAFGLFSDPQKTQTIICRLSNIDTRKWEGFTTLSMIRADRGKVSIRMRR